MIGAGLDQSAITLSMLHFNPVAFSIGPLLVRWYSLAYIAGILTGWWYLRYLLTLPGAPIKQSHADALVPWATLGILLGGRLAYILFYDPEHFLAHPIDMLKLWQGGMSFHGGVIGTSIAVFLFARTARLDGLRIHDYVVMCAPFGLFFGRLANFVNGELWGRPTNLPWGVIFPGAGGGPRHPSQLYEAFLEGPALFFMLWCLFRFTDARYRPGFLAGAFLLGYGIFRFLIEFIREPDPQLVKLAEDTGLHMGQWLCVPMILCGLGLLLATRRIHR